MKRQALKDEVTYHAAGVAFYFLLGLVPALAAIAGVYGLVADASSVTEHVAALRGLVPPDVLELLESELRTLAAADSGASTALAIGLAVSLWGSSKGVEAMMTALNVVYQEPERRGLVKRKAAALTITAGIVVFVAVVLILLVAAPAVIAFAGLERSSEVIIAVGRWPLLFGCALVGLNALYRWAPSRRDPKWRWVAPGSVAAALIWVISCVGLTLYASTIGEGSTTYGSLGAVVLLMFWLYISALAALLGGELNAEMEHQTRRDSTVGRERPMGERGAFVADTLGELKPSSSPDPSDPATR